MLSIIISSYQSQLFTSLQTNIAETCGIPYEIIKIDNPGLMGICQAYNIGGEKAQYSNLLFIHEDILFIDTNWGPKLLRNLELPNCGVIGVAGGDYYSYIPSSWSHRGHNSINIIQVVDKSFEQHNNSFTKNNSSQIVKGIDGVFLACKKDIFEKFRFNEKITGYHGYDLIFSLSVAKKYSNYIIDEILIRHFSSGNRSKDWFNSILQVREIIGQFPNQKIDKKVEMDAFYRLIFNLKNYEVARGRPILIALKYINLKKFGLITTLKMTYLLHHLINRK